jgi:NAD(P)-dependent dehydrogenase (short-subunit alcohol dehydrogenase family)
LHVNELKDIEPEDAKKDIDIGLFGSIICTKFFSPLIKDSGRILFVSSGFGLVGVAGYPVYSAVKAGVINFAGAVKRELHKRKIKVYVAVPSDIDTPGFKSEVKLCLLDGVSKAEVKSCRPIVPRAEFSKNVRKTVSGIQ